MHAILFEDRGKVNQGWNLFARTLLVLASVHILHNKTSFSQIKLEERQAVLFTSLLFILEKTTRKMQICQLLIQTCFFDYGEITVEEMASMSHCHFGKHKEKLDTELEEIYNVCICQNKKLSFCNNQLYKKQIHQPCLSGD